MIAGIIVVVLAAGMVLAVRVVPAGTLRRRGELEAEDWPEHDEHP